MLSHSSRLNDQCKVAKGVHNTESIALFCFLGWFLTLSTVVPMIMLSMMEVLPETPAYLYSQVNHKERLSMAPLASDKCGPGKNCGEIDLFNSWHKLATLE